MQVNKFNNDVTKYLDAVQKKRSDILTKSNTSYPEENFLNDILEALTLVTCDAFNSEITSMRNKWHTGKLALTSDMVIDEATILYNHMVDNGTWAREHSRHEQIITLYSKVTSLEKELKNAKAGVKAKALTSKTTPKPSDSSGNGSKKGKNWVEIDPALLRKKDNGREHGETQFELPVKGKVTM